MRGYCSELNLRGGLRTLQLGLGLLLLGLLPTAHAENAPKLSSAGNDYFEVVGMELRSVNYVNLLSGELIQLTQRYLNRPAVPFSQRVLVSLRPEQYAQFDGDYRVRVEGQGFVSLDVKWNAQLDLATLCHALLQAYLKRYVIYNFGPAEAEQMSDWPARALGQYSYLRLRPAELASVRRMLEAPALDLAELFRAPHAAGPNAPALRWESYLLLSWLEQALPVQQLRGWIEVALRGTDLTVPLQQQFAVASELTTGPWWPQMRAGIAVNENEWCERMSVSRAWLDEMASLTAFREAGVELKNMLALWGLRQEPKIREMLQARLEIIKLRLPQVNPAYFNATRALGTWYEILLSDSPQYTFMHAFTDYLTAFEDAKLLEKKTIAALERE